MPIKPVPIWATSQAHEDEMNDDHAMLWRRMIALMAEQDLTGRTVLDFGCNQGGFLRLLHGIRPYERAVGIDIATESVALAVARRGLVPADYRVATDLAEFPETFDIAFSHEVLYLLEDIGGHAREIHSALKPGGVYYAAIGCHADSPEWPRWRNLIQTYSSLPVHGRTLDGYAEVFRTAGFQVFARRFAVDEFIRLSTGDAFATVGEQLDYYTGVKTLFRLIKAR